MTISPRRAALAALAAVAGVALASCTVPTAGVAMAATATSGHAPPELDRYYTQQLAWGPCTPFAGNDADRAAFAAPGLDCATLTVPLDYSQPDGRVAEIAVLRHRTTAAAGRVGSLVVNPGGPGGSGIELAAQFGAAQQDGPFDVVGFDPRGVGASTPAIDCMTDKEIDAQRAETDVDVSPAAVARLDEENRRAAALCVERSGGADVIAHSDTRDVARDMDVLRAALGEQKLTYLGYSYGTRIGSSYAELFPGNVRAMVLDGAIDPTQSALDSAVAQMQGFQKAFEAFAADCAGKPGCPLPGDPAGATAAYQALVRPLIEKPAPVRDSDRTLSYSDAVTATIAALYNPAAWPKLTAGLTELRAGDGTTLMTLADAYYGRTAQGAYGNSQEALMVVNCADGARVDDPEVTAETARKVNEVAPFQDSGIEIPATRNVCSYLPVEPVTPHLPKVDGLPQTLVVSTTGDPSTPYQAGVSLARALDARLLTFEGTQHTIALQGNRCVDTIVGNYLVNLSLPPADPRCTAGTS
ncbi:MAG: alpha/beta hydrolase [Pseudonocardia sp.]|uniref:alpha/beta hydrolase n=1 Tax=unclassified Pseudonocardia TaxID=2619320 RepID=UPI00086830E2|nr:MULTISPECIES: alpha/beta hydrolase [unclassified Pseudonocardia]MBN9109338.1 alpha/beta hydrolase [Pseudonocardia sp.]ODU13582.1 MAG: hydrolase [Pseudonocardia sp. SCN 72-51]ODV08050.1 MAG: hydrolase [Pseudonocardia sp. SCN 73-27]